MYLSQAIEVQGQRVLMTRQLAEAYGTERQIISNNYTRNKKRYVMGKHVITLEGEELKEFKAKHQIDDNLKFAHTLYLWTEKGALLHAKSLNTDKAWEVYDYLVDFYFRAKEKQPEKTCSPAKSSNEAKPMTTSRRQYQVVDIPENVKAQKLIGDITKRLNAMEVLLEESNRYTDKQIFENCRRGFNEAFMSLVHHVTEYNKIVPGMITRQ